MKTFLKTKSGDISKTSQEHWNQVSKNLDKLYVHNPYFQYKKGELLRLINQWGKDKINKKILKTDLYEEATGRDDFLFDIAKNNPEVYGIDISPEIVKRAINKEKNKGLQINFSVQDVRKLEFPNNSFDLIISNSTLDHFPEVDIAIKELYRVLNNNGTLILTLHNKRNPLLYLLLKITKLFNWHYNFYSDSAYSIKETENLMQKFGFKTTDSTTILHLPPLLPSVINKFYKTNNKFLMWFGQKIITFFKFIGEKKTFLNYFTGYLIAVKGIKK